MAITSLPAPGLILRQRFARQVATTIQPLSAFFVGPAAYVLRQSVADEKDLGRLGLHSDVGTLIDGSQQTIYAWPNRPAGSVIDTAFTKLFVRKGLLRYYYDQAQTAVQVLRNTVRHPTLIFTTNTYGTSNVGSRGVLPGDLVYISGVDEDTEPFSLSTYVLRVIGDAVAAVIGSPAGASSNTADQAADADIVEGGANTTDLDATTSGAAYSGLASGHVTETYTVTVLTGGLFGVARLSVVSGSGTDSQASISPAALASPTSIGTRGLTVTFVEGTSTNFVVGNTWTVTVSQVVAVRTLVTAGTYTGTKDRTYVVEVVKGATIAAGTAEVRVTSQDGTDTLPKVVVTQDAGPLSDPFALGSFGLTATLSTTSGLILGDKFTVSVVASKEGIGHTLSLAHDFPANVALDDTAELEIELMVSDDVEIPIRSETVGVYQWSQENTQILVKAAATVATTKWSNGGIFTRLPLVYRTGFGAVSELYVQYRAWLPKSSDVIGVAANDDLDLLIPGPTDPDNPLKYAMALARGAAGGETMYFYAVGNPDLTAGWTAALAAASKVRSTYGMVPLTLEPEILSLFFSHVGTLNGERKNYYRVLWTGSENLVGGPVADFHVTTNDLPILATAEDNPSASGTQYSLLRLQSANVDFIELDVRPGDEIRFLYEVDGWGDEVYTSRVVDQVLSASQILVTSPYAGPETISKRMEIHRVYLAGDLRELYGAAAAAWASDLVRYVLAPQIVVGGYTVPSYYAAGLIAGIRSTQPAQRSLSTTAVPGVTTVLGVEDIGDADLDRLAADGCMILYNDYETSDVRIRHAVTTGETEVLAKREESMVSARHANLFAIVDRLKPYASQLNLGGDIEDLSQLIRAELDSVKRELQVRNATPSLGGQLLELFVDQVGEMIGAEDTIVIIARMELGRPGNVIDCSVLIS